MIHNDFIPSFYLSCDNEEEIFKFNIMVGKFTLSKCQQINIIAYSIMGRGLKTIGDLDQW